MKWFEDPTNADPSLTARNAIRALLFADPPVLPKALQKPALANLARRATSKDAEIMRKAREFVKGCQVKLNPLIGTVQLRLPQKSLEGMKEEVAEVLLRALTIVAGEVTPLKNIKRKSMVNVLSNAFRPDQTHPLRFTAAGLVWFRDTKDVWNIQRVPHTLRSRAATTVEFKLEVRKWSEWKLWDGRWWIRIMSLDGSNESVVVRPLMQEDLKQLKKRLKDLGKEYLMDRYLRVLRHNCRFTVPVVAIEEPGLDFSGILVALPSFNLDLMNKVGGQGTQSGKLVRWEMEFRRPIS